MLLPRWLTRARWVLCFVLHFAVTSGYLRNLYTAFNELVGSSTLGELPTRMGMLQAFQHQMQAELAAG